MCKDSNLCKPQIGLWNFQSFSTQSLPFEVFMELRGQTALLCAHFLSFSKQSLSKRFPCKNVVRISSYKFLELTVPAALGKLYKWWKYSLHCVIYVILLTFILLCFLTPSPKTTSIFIWSTLRIVFAIYGFLLNKKLYFIILVNGR
jgi:hypothetical protein